MIINPISTFLATLRIKTKLIHMHHDGNVACETGAYGLLRTQHRLPFVKNSV